MRWKFREEVREKKVCGVSEVAFWERCVVGASCPRSLLGLHDVVARRVELVAGFREGQGSQHMTSQPLIHWRGTTHRCKPYQHQNKHHLHYTTKNT